MNSIVQKFQVVKIILNTLRTFERLDDFSNHKEMIKNAETKIKELNNIGGDNTQVRSLAVELSDIVRVYRSQKYTQQIDVEKSLEGLSDVLANLLKDFNKMTAKVEELRNIVDDHQAFFDVICKRFE